MNNVSAVACGGNHTVAITIEGSAYAFGSNEHGQLGSENGPVEFSATPNKIATNVSDAFLSYETGLYITKDKMLFAWGNGTSGQLGNGKMSACVSPQFVMSDCVSADIGNRHSAAVTSKGELYQWGSFYYEAGNQVPDILQRTEPKKVLDNCVYVSCGSYHTAAITKDGDPYAWGSNMYFQVGLTSEQYYMQPQLIMKNVRSVTCSNYATYAITNAGELFAWGANEWGELGLQDENVQIAQAPTKIADNVASVSAFYSHTMILMTNGEVYAFGANAAGAFREETETQNAHEHTRVFEDYHISSVSCGVGHTAFITAQGNLYTTGLNTAGQLCDGTTSDRLTPVLTRTGIKAAVTAQWITAYIDNSGTLYACGLNENALLGLPCTGSVVFVMSGVRTKGIVKHANVGLAECNIYSAPTEVYIDKTFSHNDRTKTVVQASQSEKYATCYDALTTYEKHIYECLDRALPDTYYNMTGTHNSVLIPCIALSDMGSPPYEAMIAAYFAYVFDHPEAFWLNAYSVTVYGPAYPPAGEEYGYNIKCLFDSAAGIKDAEVKLNRKLGEITSSNETGMIDKLRYAYDMVIAMQVPKASSESPIDYSACSVLCDSKMTPTSAAYAYTMRLVCDRLGLYSTVVRGKYDGETAYWITVLADDGNYYALDAFCEALYEKDSFMKGDSFLASREYASLIPSYVYPALNEEDYKGGSYAMYEYQKMPIYTHTYNRPLERIQTGATPEDGKSYVLACEFNGRIYALSAENIAYADGFAKGMRASNITSLEGIEDSALIWTVKAVDNGFELENNDCMLSANTYLCVGEQGKSGSVFSYDMATGTLIDNKDRTVRLCAADIDTPVFDSKLFNRSSNPYSRIIFIEYEWQLGDCNMDGTVNTGDAVLILRSCVESVTLNERETALADMNKDDNINTGDAVKVLKYCVELRQYPHI